MLNAPISSFPIRRASAVRARNWSAIGLVAGLAACATITTPSRFNVPVDSVPQGAQVRYHDKVVGVTPCTVELPREQGAMLSLRLDGHHEHHAEVGNTTAPWPAVIVDLIVFPLIVVDVIANVDGALDTAPIKVHLRPSDAEPPTIWRRSDYDPNAPKKASGGAVIVVPPAVR